METPKFGGSDTSKEDRRESLMSHSSCTSGTLPSLSVPQLVLPDSRRTLLLGCRGTEFGIAKGEYGSIQSSHVPSGLGESLSDRPPDVGLSDVEVSSRTTWSFNCTYDGPRVGKTCHEEPMSVVYRGGVVLPLSPSRGNTNLPLPWNLGHCS